MDHKVFEPVGAKPYLFRNEKETEVEDTNTSLYRFVNSSLTPLLLRKNKDNESLFPEQIKSKRKAKGRSKTKCEITLSNPLALEAADKKRVEELLQSIKVHASLPANFMANETTHRLSKREDILVSSVKTKPDSFGKEDNLIISSTFLDREFTSDLSLPESVIIKTCTKFLQNKTFSKPQAELLTQFLMDNHSELFKTPLILLELTSRRLESLLERQVPDINSGVTFCQCVTTKEYENQTQQTNQHLLTLVLETDNDPHYSLEAEEEIKEF